MKKIKHSNMTKRFLAIGLMLAGIIYINIYFYGAFEEQISLINANSRQNAIEGISNYYTQVDVMTNTIIVNSHVLELRSLKTKKEAYQSQSSLEVISLFKLLNRMPGGVNYVYIYLEEIDLIMCSDGIIERDIFYETIGKAYTSSVDEWDQVAVKPEEKSGFRMLGEGVVFTVKQQFLGSNEEYTIGMIADLSDIFVDNTNAKWIDASNVYIFDRYGTLRLKNENMEIPTLGDNPNYSEIYSLRGEYDFAVQGVSVGDKQYDVFFLFEKGLDMALVKQLQLLLAAVMVISFVVLSYFVYLQIVEKYRPFKQLAELLNMDVSGLDFRLLHSPIKNMMDDNDELNRIVEDKNSMLNLLVFEKLLSGNLNGSSREELSKLGFHFKYNRFVVVALYLYSDVDNTAEMKQKIADEITKELKNKLENKACTAYFLSRGEYVICILNLDEDYLDTDKLKNQFESIIELADIRYELVISVIISKSCNELWQISLAYSDVLNVIRESELYRKSRIILCENKESGEPSFDVDMARETELMFALKNGNYHAAKEIIYWYTEKNRKDAVGYSYSNKSLDLVYALIRISGGDPKFRSEMKSIFTALKNIENTELVRNVCCNFAKKICCEVKDISKKENLASEVIALIHKNYADSQLCLEFISDTLGFSAVHLNNLFKEEYKMTIAAYLSNYRIQKAKEIILEGIAIKEVAERVGISNIRTFNRLFHGVTGMTPSEYKNKCKGRRCENE